MTLTSSISFLQRAWRVLASAAVLLALVLPPCARAQEHSPSPRQAQTTPQPPPAGENAVAQGTTSELAQASREAAGEGENLKQYPSVMFLARHLGISPRVAFWLSIVFNFAVLAGGLGYLMKKYLPGAFRDRNNSIRKAITEAERSSEEARRRLAEIENRLARLDSEIAAMHQAAERDAAAEETRIRTAAEEDTRKIIEAAEQEIGAAANLARRELKSYAAEVAVSLAQRQLHVDATTDEALVRSFAAQLDGHGPGGRGGRDGR